MFGSLESEKGSSSSHSPSCTDSGSESAWLSEEELETEPEILESEIPEILRGLKDADKNIQCEALKKLSRVNELTPEMVSAVLDIKNAHSDVVFCAGDTLMCLVPKTPAHLYSRVEAILEAGQKHQDKWICQLATRAIPFLPMQDAEPPESKRRVVFWGDAVISSDEEESEEENQGLML